MFPPIPTVFDAIHRRCPPRPSRHRDTYSLHTRRMPGPQARQASPPPDREPEGDAASRRVDRRGDSPPARGRWWDSAPLFSIPGPLNLSHSIDFSGGSRVGCLKKPFLGPMRWPVFGFKMSKPSLFCLATQHFQGVGVESSPSTEAHRVLHNSLISGRYFDDLTGFWDSA